jgi:hypothetical protein
MGDVGRAETDARSLGCVGGSDLILTVGLADRRPPLMNADLYMVNPLGATRRRNYVSAARGSLILIHDNRNLIYRGELLLRHA